MSTGNVWSLPAEPAAPGPGARGGRVVLVCGGRQGVGVSTVAALFALVERGDVLLAEAGDTGVVHRLFRAFRPETGGDLVEARPTPVLTDLAVVSLGSGDPRATARRLAQLRARFALTVVDGGARLDPALEVAAAGVDQLLCVTTSDPIASAGAYAMIKALSARVPGLPVGVLVNRAPLWAATEVDHHLRQAVGQFLRREIDLIRQVPLDDCLRAGIRAGMPLHEVAAGSPAALALYEVAQDLLLKQSHLSPTVFAPRPLQRRS